VTWVLRSRSRKRWLVGDQQSSVEPLPEPVAGYLTTIALPDREVEPDDFRQTMGVFPSPVSIVTALDTEGVPRGLTCSAVCSLSMDPPALLVCVNRRNQSLRALQHSQGFVVNLLRAGRHEVSDVFASSSPTKFAGTKWQQSPASGLPVLAGDIVAYVDCRLQAEITAGSHVILVGLVRESRTSSEVDGPLVYWRRTYCRWTPPGSEAGQTAIVAPIPPSNEPA
jgi:flavin reductase (DIM6/NTAB) family NADH-FMN oxidoreductase RutF